MYGASQNYRRIVGNTVHPYTSQHSHLINVIREVVDRWNHKENQLQQRRDDDYRFEHGYRGDVSHQFSNHASLCLGLSFRESSIMLISVHDGKEI